MQATALLLATALAASNAVAQGSAAPRIPPDITRYVTPAQLKSLDEAMKPHVDRARATYPATRERFVAGLPRGEALFATARLYDERGKSELAFILVAAITGGIIEGRIWSEPRVATNYRFRDHYAFPDDQLVDWSLVRVDGTVEGNVVGRFLAR